MAGCFFGVTDLSLPAGPVQSELVTSGQHSLRKLFKANAFVAS